ncbi:MAG: hypothetical protein BRC26_02810 [Nanohaloarchaea archaeon QH_8_44_6]|nr:MAG: hypothetical protein BRC26_02810 [Nanohaloarchaea archaeon QH_8_44_6]
MGDFMESFGEALESYWDLATVSAEREQNIRGYIFDSYQDVSTRTYENELARTPEFGSLLAETYQNVEELIDRTASQDLKQTAVALSEIGYDIELDDEVAMNKQLKWIQENHNKVFRQALDETSSTKALSTEISVARGMFDAFEDIYDTIGSFEEDAESMENERGNDYKTAIEYFQELR